MGYELNYEVPLGWKYKYLIIKLVVCANLYISYNKIVHIGSNHGI